MNSSPGITTIQSSMDTSDFSIYQIIAIVIIFLIVASIIYYIKDFLYAEWRKLYPINELTGESTLLNALEQGSANILAPLGQSIPEKVDDSKSTNNQSSNSLTSIEKPHTETQASSEQTWCLVGEDMAGRWCIQVQSSKHCEPVRTYKTKNQCEQSNEKAIVA